MMLTKDGPLFSVLFFVAAGAAVGACLRWGISSLFNSKWAFFPLGTLLCNWVGAFAIGVVTAWLIGHPEMPPAVKLFLVTGLLGGLTTFSTFSLEAVTLLQQQEWVRALAHTLSHLVGSVLLTGVGFYVYQRFS